MLTLIDGLEAAFLAFGGVPALPCDEMDHPFRRGLLD
jgi:hypothetical protein